MQKKKKNQAHAGVEPPTPLASLRHTTVIVTLTRGMGLPTVLHGLVACHTQQIRPTHTSTSSSAFYAPTNQHVRILLALIIVKHSQLPSFSFLPPPFPCSFYQISILYCIPISCLLALHPKSVPMRNCTFDNKYLII